MPFLERIHATSDRCGRWYFEVVVAGPACMQLGWADSAFAPSSSNGIGVGDDQHSWGVDGWRGLAWHGGQKQPWGVRWKVGDVVGCAVDMEARQMWFSLNGKWGAPMGRVPLFDGFDFEGWLCPAVSLQWRPREGKPEQRPSLSGREGCTVLVGGREGAAYMSALRHEPPTPRSLLGAHGDDDREGEEDHSDAEGDSQGGEAEREEGDDAKLVGEGGASRCERG